MVLYALVRRCVNEVAAVFKEGVEELEAALLVHGSHTVLRPLVADTHRTETERADTYTGTGREDAVLGEGRRWWAVRSPKVLSSGFRRHC